MVRVQGMGRRSEEGDSRRMRLAGGGRGGVKLRIEGGVHERNVGDGVRFRMI